MIVKKKKKKKLDIRSVAYWSAKREIVTIEKKVYIEGQGSPSRDMGYWSPIQAVIFLHALTNKNKVISVDEYGNVWDEREGDPWIGEGSIYEFIEEEYGYTEQTAVGTAWIEAELGAVPPGSPYLREHDSRLYIP